MSMLKVQARPEIEIEMNRLCTISVFSLMEVLIYLGTGLRRMDCCFVALSTIVIVLLGLW